MTGSETLPSSGALEEVRRLAGPSAVILGAVRLAGGQHAETWRVDTENPAISVVVRQFPVDDPAPLREQRVLLALDGLGGLAPVSLGGDLNGHRSKHPTSLTSWLDGHPDITPDDPGQWARELGRALAAVHTVPVGRLVELPRVFDRSGGSQEILGGPLAEEVRSRWSQVIASPEVLSHCDYWSGNVVWRHGTLPGIVDWSDGGPAHVASTWAGVGSTSSYSSTSRLPTTFLRPMKQGSARQSKRSACGTVGLSRDPTTRLDPGLRTTCHWAGPTSRKINFADAMRNGRRGSENRSR